MRTHLIRLWREGDSVKYIRQYVGRNSVSGPIEVDVSGLSAVDIAKKIHWGCCGWSAGAHQIHGLIDRVEEFLGGDADYVEFEYSNYGPVFPVFR